MFSDLHFLGTMFSSLSGTQLDAFEDTAVLFVGEDEDLIRLLERERDVGLEDNVPREHIPSDEECEQARSWKERQEEIMDIQCRLGRGFKLYGKLREWMNVFYDKHPAIKKWFAARESLNKMKNVAERHGMNSENAEKEFWKKHRQTWLDSKSAWEGAYGQKATDVNDRIKRVWARLQDLLEQQRGMRISNTEWAFIFKLAAEEITRYETSSGNVHWSQEHLSEAERWYGLQELERAQMEFETFCDLWGKPRY